MLKSLDIQRPTVEPLHRIMSPNQNNGKLMQWMSMQRTNPCKWKESKPSIRDKCNATAPCLKKRRTSNKPLTRSLTSLSIQRMRMEMLWLKLRKFKCASCIFQTKRWARCLEPPLDSLSLEWMWFSRLPLLSWLLGSEKTPWVSS